MKQAKKKTEKNQLDSRDDKLALMVQRGFLEVNKNINQVIEELGEKIGRLEERMDRMEVKMDRIEERMDRMEKRMEKVEDQLADVLNNQDKIIKDLEDLKEENTMDIVIHGRMEKRITHLEREMAKVKVKVKV